MTALDSVSADERVVAVIAQHYDPTRCVREHGMPADKPMVAAHAAHVAAALAPVLAEVRAEALREAADELDGEDDSTIEPHPWVRDQEDVRIIRWLRDRADRIGGTP